MIKTANTFNPTTPIMINNPKNTTADLKNLQEKFQQAPIIPNSHIYNNQTNPIYKEHNGQTLAQSTNIIHIGTNNSCTISSYMIMKIA